MSGGRGERSGGRTVEEILDSLRSVPGAVAGIMRSPAGWQEKTLVGGSELGGIVRDARQDVSELMQRTPALEQPRKDDLARRVNKVLDGFWDVIAAETNAESIANEGELNKLSSQWAGILLELEEALPSSSAATEPEEPGAMAEEGSGRSASTETDAPGRLSAHEIADRYELPYEALRKRLERWRGTRLDGWIEREGRRPRQAKLFYDVHAIQDVIASLRHASG